jgi:hypothetical protein
MGIPLAMKFEGKKYMWDGMTYESEDQARQAMEAYSKDGFEVQLVSEDHQHLIYSRRIVVAQTSK